MILEELIGSFVSLVSSSICRIPPISRENPQRNCTLIFQEDGESQEVDNGLIHREYEHQTREAPADLPQHAENIPILEQADEEHRRNSCESFLRSCMTNLGMLIAVLLIIGLLTIGVVYIDLNTNDVCIAWIRADQKILKHIKILQIVGSFFSNLFFVSWFPAIVVMLWGFQQFKKHYFSSLSVISMMSLLLICIYRTLMWNKFVKSKDNIYM